MYDLRESILAKNDIIIQLDDGRYALKWYDSDVDTVKKKYEQISEKILRNPSPEEFAGLMKKTPSEARDMLYKFIAGYHEPTSDEIVSSEKLLLKKIVLAFWAKSSLPTDKKSLYERGIRKIIVQGIDKETLEEILAGIESNSYNDAQVYVKKHPSMESTISPLSRDKNQLQDTEHYKTEWSEDARCTLRTIKPWNQTAEALVPWKFDESYQFFLECCVDTSEFLDELSKNYVPSKRVLDYILKVLDEPYHEVSPLVALKKFCKNALEVGQLKDEMIEKLNTKLAKIAFSEEIVHRNADSRSHDESFERDTAFEIMELFNVRKDEIIEPAKNYAFRILRNPQGFDNDGYIKGPELSKVVVWLAKDPHLRKNLIDRTKNLWKDETEPNNILFYNYFLDSLLR